MGIVNSAVSAIGRLAATGLLAFAFLFGLAAVVYMSLQGAEVHVPELTGKSFSESEKELALLGLKIKKRADRNSPEAINTIIEQLPKPGDTVKTGQTIRVVTSKGESENSDKTSFKKIEDEDDSEKIEEMIDDKPKKSKSNTRKKADTTRDAGANTSTSSNSNSESSNSNKKESGANNNSSEKPNKSTQPTEKKEKPNIVGKPNGETKPKPKPAVR